MSEIRDLADEVHALLMAADPFSATLLGVPGHDAEVPDMSRAAAAARSGTWRRLLHRAGDLEARGTADPRDTVTLSATRHLLEAHLAHDEAATVEHTLSPMADGPSVLLLLVSQTRLRTLASAHDYLERVRGFASYVDGCAQRLREGLAEGRTPVATLARVVLGQLDGYLGSPVDATDAVAGVAAPAELEDADVWRGQLVAAVRDSVRPAVARYRALVADELLPAARDDEHCGLLHLPRGLEDYDRLIRVHTTLPLAARDVHEVGLAAVESLVAQMTELGARLGIGSFAEVLEQARTASAGVDPEQAMARARVAVARAEAVTPQWFPEPLPAPCTVEAMSDHLGSAGLPPMYVPPSPDGARQGTYLFNTVKLGAGSGWDLEATAYHEAVPGHHLQVSRALLQTDLPAIQREGIVTAQAEGWGLYAEHLAADMGLYTDEQQQLGALAMRTTRAARLVVDTGLHALGWSRQQAVDYMSGTCPLPVEFLASEVNRYIGYPGQALAYFTGYQEILRLRALAEQELGAAFDVREFHGALLGAGSVPLPALRTAVDAWVAARAA
ncbi:uncharacterized protein (DUF885 family) [Motilibacter peucedani]|uniref:Uncharacterized protein (DUF885 family) n=1 Tax=Motilibacter peucedani TaxID=598650 RepID=A0A420XM86_9ACTN|nr:DUF885 domain-containing protein [Motilibacter peucedani]RKS72491.1 uncharacterized protein (DUF885 family) [Motilibacter peucedani]